MALDLTTEFPFDAGDPGADAATRAAAIDALERGRILHLPRLGFEVRPEERRFLSEEWLDRRSKNVYLRGPERRLRGAKGESR